MGQVYWASNHISHTPCKPFGQSLCTPLPPHDTAASMRVPPCAGQVHSRPADIEPQSEPPWVELHASWCQPFLPTLPSTPISVHPPSRPLGHGHGPSRAGSAAKASAAPPNETAIAARVHWLVASVAVHAAQPAEDAEEEEEEEGAGAGACARPRRPCVEHCVHVWAIDGLASAAVAGVARGGLHPGTSGPRAVLWGTRQGQRSAVRSLTGSGMRGCRQDGSGSTSSTSVSASVGPAGVGACAQSIRWVP